MANNLEIALICWCLYDVLHYFYVWKTMQMYAMTAEIEVLAKDIHLAKLLTQHLVF